MSWARDILASEPEPEPPAETHLSRLGKHKNIGRQENYATHMNAYVSNTSEQLE